jgi:pSer/pThr/pTyr-binding forkhead associated (FHA) protein
VLPDVRHSLPRVILEASLGPLQGTKRVLAPGEKIRVGRREKADLVVPDDLMSAPHFEIAWDGTRCTLKDLRSQKGTFVGGQKVKQAELGNASWIRAGGSDFFLFFEDATPPPVDHEVELLDADEDDVPPALAHWLRLNRDKKKGAVKARDARAEAALEVLRDVPSPLFAVLDGARSDRILTLLQESVEVYRSLYEGTEGDALAHVAPYLVSLPRGSRLLGHLVREGWGRRWGSFLACRRPFKEVRRHLRRFLMVADADTRRRYYFRFYDPGVLRSFFPEATERQRIELFGDVETFLVEGERGELLRFEREEVA